MDAVLNTVSGQVARLSNLLCRHEAALHQPMVCQVCQRGTRLCGQTLARGSLKNKHSELLQALAGKINDHHRRMLDRLLRALETREREIAEDERDIRPAD